MESRDADLSHLHPVFRGAVVKVLEELARRQIPMALFEGYRSPKRQKYLFGMTPRVTHARPWKSFHQYGLAADIVLHIDGQWVWNDDGQNAEYWRQLHEIGHSHGLDSAVFEPPHLQLNGVTLSQLEAGRYPEGGDDHWATALEESIVAWTVSNAPPVPQILPCRPAMVA